MPELVTLETIDLMPLGRLIVREERTNGVQIALVARTAGAGSQLEEAEGKKIVYAEWVPGPVFAEGAIVNVTVKVSANYSWTLRVRANAPSPVAATVSVQCSLVSEILQRKNGFTAWAGTGAAPPAADGMEVLFERLDLSGRSQAERTWSATKSMTAAAREILTAGQLITGPLSASASATAAVHSGGPETEAILALTTEWSFSASIDLAGK